MANTWEIVHDYVTQKGDELTIRSENWEVYATVIYRGKTKNGDYKFQSVTYGWYWFISKDKTEIWCEHTPNKKWKNDKDSGKYLP